MRIAIHLFTSLYNADRHYVDNIIILRQHTHSPSLVSVKETSVFDTCSGVTCRIREDVGEGNLHESQSMVEVTTTAERGRFPPVEIS